MSNARSELQNAIMRYQRPLVKEELERLTGPKASITSGESSSTSNSILLEIPSNSNNESTVLSPTAAGELICQVQCKWVHRYCSYSSVHCQFSIAIGVFVIISCDMEGSFELGVITRIYNRKVFEAKRSTQRPSNDREESEIRKILRLPTEKECKFLPSKHAEEEDLLVVCQDYVKIFQLPMEVYGADFQFDGKVLTFYYTSATRADYRELVRTIFNRCMVRIKMRKTNQCKRFVPVPFATQALRTGIIQMEDTS